MIDLLAKRLLELLPADSTALPRGVTTGRVLKLVSECLGEDMTRFPDGRMLIWNIARHDGYNIPPYPMAGCGDVREFLSDEGARNVPDWYERHLGISRALYDRLYEYELFMVRNRGWWRKVFLVPAALTSRLDAQEGPLVSEMRNWMEFALGNTTDADDPTLFRR